MNEGLKSFLIKLSEDEALQQRIAQCSSPAEAYSVASSIAEGFTEEEFYNTMTEINRISNEITTEDLAEVAGGAVPIINPEEEIMEQEKKDDPRTKPKSTGQQIGDFAKDLTLGVTVTGTGIAVAAAIASI